MLHAPTRSLAVVRHNWTTEVARSTGTDVIVSDVVLETAVLVSRPLETVLVLALPVLVLDLVLKDWSRVFFEISHVAKMPTGASSRTAAEHILSAIWRRHREQCTSTEEATILTLCILHEDNRFSIWRLDPQMPVWRPSLTMISLNVCAYSSHVMCASYLCPVEHIF